MLDVKKLLTKTLTWIETKDYQGYGTSVDISSYTSSNKYTVPKDGIVTVTCTYRSASYIILYRGDGNALAEMATSSANSQGNLIISIPVFKGMQLYVTRSSTYSNAIFYPYTT